MKNEKKVLKYCGQIRTLFLLAIMMGILFGSKMTVQAAPVTIQCGDNVYGTLDEMGTLTISGTGDMWDATFYSDGSGSSFYRYRNDIYEVVIQEGVTSVGAGAFKGLYNNNNYNYKNLVSVSIPSTVDTIGNSAFNACSALKTCKLSKGLKTIGMSAFENCLRLENIIIPENVTTISERAFYNSSKHITVSKGVGIIKDEAFGGNCPVITLDTDNVRLSNSAFEGSSYSRVTLLVRKGSTGEAYAKSNSSKIILKYIKCTSGHSWDVGSVLTEATCTTPGLKLYTCKVCDATQTEEIKALGHAFKADATVAPTCTEDGYTKYTCSSCGNTYNAPSGATATGHQTKTVTTKATPKKAGSVVTSCRTCGQKLKTVSISRIKNASLSKTTYKYNGKAKKPKVVVKDTKGKVISKNNYTVTYKDNKKIGKGTVIIKFKGKKYSGTIKKKFTIKK